MKLLVYDVEIVNAIPERGAAPLDGITYCKGWTDYFGMGVAVVCAYEWERGYHVYLKDNFAAFRELAEAPDTLCIGYNNRSFDDRLVEQAISVSIAPNRSWDLLRAIRVARGDSPGAPGGPTLDALCRANFLAGKTGSGAFAPLLWQKGKYGQVVDYCLNDVIQLKKLVELVIAGRLRDPDSGRILPVTMPGDIAVAEPL